MSASVLSLHNPSTKAALTPLHSPPTGPEAEGTRHTYQRDHNTEREFSPVAETSGTQNIVSAEPHETDVFVADTSRNQQ